jgi:hypothetical protein
MKSVPSSLTFWRAPIAAALRLVATIENPSVVARILEHLGLAVDLSSPAPARSTEWLPGWSD